MTSQPFAIGAEVVVHCPPNCTYCTASGARRFDDKIGTVAYVLLPGVSSHTVVVEFDLGTDLTATANYAPQELAPATEIAAPSAAGFIPV